MKAAGSNTLAALSGGQYHKAELFSIALASGVTLRFTDYDLPLTVGANTYASNFIVKRGAFTQRIGLDAQGVDLELAPQGDAVSPPTVGGLPFLQAVRLGFFDGARVTMSKVFMAPSGTSTLPTNTNGESVLWFTGEVADATAGRQTARLNIESDLAGLNVQMPRNLIQAGCLHSLFDSGCTLAKATYASTGAVTATGPNTASTFTTGLAQAADYFALGVVAFTSGANSGISRTVRSFASGVVTLVAPLPSVPATSDAFSITPGCDKQQATCSAKFSNLSHFRGYPYVPVPETLYDGGSVSAPAPTIGGQGYPGTGSPWPGNLPGYYVP